ncbi:MAG: tetratricopeptide repeat protein [Desulfobacterales bacterium]|nr:tetratricopeptide repeat protein [Desulfobacterales bacterium]
MPRQEAEAAGKRKDSAKSLESFYAEVDELDRLSNSVPALVKAGRLEDAEAACHELLERYPDQADGLERLAEVYEARGDNEKAIEYYLKSSEFMKSHPGFDQEAIDWQMQQAERLKQK